MGDNDMTPHPRIPQRPREKPMAVLALGLSRTGSLSTYTALKQLGYNPYHMAENMRDNANGSMKGWNEAVRAKYNGEGVRWQGEDFEKLLWRYDATTDAPCALFGEELIEAYPGAKVVLNVRDPKKWTFSVMDNFLYFLSGWRWVYLRNFDPSFSGRWYHLTYTCLHVWSGGDLHNPDAYLKYGITRHNAEIRRLVPNENLLEFHPSDGWKPLCEFLGKEVPQGEFPNINEGAELKRLLDKVLLIQMVMSVGTYLAWVSPVVVGVGAWWWFGR